MGLYDSIKAIVLDVIGSIQTLKLEEIRSQSKQPLRMIHESGAELELRQDGKAYYNDTEIGTGGGGGDHGALTGLSDDDHTQYVLADGTRAMTGNLLLGANNITNIGSMNFGAAPTIATTDAGEILFKALTTTMFGMTKTLNKSYVPLDMNGQAITNAAIAGTDNTSFTLDQDGAGASTVLNFNTGGTSALSQLNGTVTLDIPEFDRFYIDINGASEYYFNEDELAMYGNKIIGLGAGTANGDAIRYEQLVGQYLPLSGGTLSGTLGMNSNNIISIGNIGFGAAPNLTTTDAGTFTFKALTTTILSFTKTLITFAKELAMSGNKITGLGTPTADTDAATKAYADNLSGTDNTSFTLDQDGAGVSSQLEFERGATANALLKWNETADWFEFHQTSGTYGGVSLDKVYLGNSSVYIDKNAGGDMELVVASGDSIVFKAV